MTAAAGRSRDWSSPLVMLAVGLWLARDLTAASKMQDCLMSGRTNCNVIQPAQ